MITYFQSLYVNWETNTNEYLRFMYQEGLAARKKNMQFLLYHTITTVKFAPKINIS